MAARQPARSSWRQDRKDCWTRSLGHRGTRVRLFQKRNDGLFYRATWYTQPGAERGRRSIVSLDTHDRNEAERLGKALLAALLQGAIPAIGPVALGELCERFQRENGEQVNNKPRSRADDAMRAKVLVASFGSGLDVRLLTALHCHQFAQARRRGGIRLSEAVLTAPTAQRTVDADSASCIAC